MAASLLDVAKLEAKFLELAFQVVLGRVEVRVASGRQFLSQFEEAGVDGVTVCVLHVLNPFRWRAGARPALGALVFLLGGDAEGYPSVERHAFELDIES